MTDWLVTITLQGVITQFKLGDGYEDHSVQQKEKELNSDSVINRAKILFVFHEGRRPQDDYRDNKLIKKYVQKMKNEFYSSNNAWNQGEMWGYKMRQNTIKGQPYIEIISRVDADTLGEFQKLSAQDLLYSTVKLMYPTKNDAAKTVVKWIQKLEDYDEEDNY